MLYIFLLGGITIYKTEKKFYNIEFIGGNDVSKWKIKINKEVNPGISRFIDNAFGVSDIGIRNGPGD